MQAKDKLDFAVEAKEASADRASGGVGASTLEVNRLGRESESAKKARHLVEMSGAASRGETPTAHDPAKSEGESYGLHPLEHVIQEIENDIQEFYNSQEDGDAIAIAICKERERLLEKIRTALRIERSRIQGTQDFIDATLYSLMGRRLIAPMSLSRRACDVQNIITQRERDQPIPQHNNKISAVECNAMARKIEHVRLQLKSRDAKNLSQKISFLKQDEILAQSADMFRAVAAEIQEKKDI